MSLLATSSIVDCALRCSTVATTLMTAVIVLCLADANRARAQEGLIVESSAFADNATIPTQYACTGADKSPPLKWSRVPDGTEALALIVDDPDAPGGTFVHWVVYDIPPSSTGLESGAPQGDAVPNGGKQGINGFNKVGYNGPCPPPGTPHHYHFRVFALDEVAKPGSPATASALEEAMKGHVKASGELVGIFKR